MIEIKIAGDNLEIEIGRDQRFLLGCHHLTLPLSHVVGAEPWPRIELPDDPYGEVIPSVPDPDGTAQAIRDAVAAHHGRSAWGRGVTTG